MTQAVDIILSALLVLGGIFGLIGSFGLIKLREGMQRLHAPTKASTIGVGTALIASAAAKWLVSGTGSTQEILVVIFLFLTAPLSALYLAKTHIFLNLDRQILPDPETGTSWATLEDQPKV